MADAAAIHDLVDKMRQERGRLLTEVERLDDAAASAVPVGKTGEEQWSVKEQLAHLIEMERNYDAWVEACLHGDDPDLGSIRAQPAALTIANANQHSVRDLLDGMAAERERTLSLIAHLTPEAFDRTGRHPMFGRLTVLQWLRSFYRHDRMHRDQILLREPEYRPRFVDGREPDQRVPRV